MDRPPARRLAICLVGLAVVAAGLGLGNGFVYDDVAIIAENPLVHRLDTVREIWGSSYWPSGLLYRPLAIQLYAIEWAAGGGSPLAFHVTNLLLAVATTLLVWRVARHFLTAWPAFAAAALFAVHPVHVEVTANVVGQAELLVTVFALLAIERYLAWRAEGALPRIRRACLAALTLLAILSKETGYAVPLLLAAAELTVVRAKAGRAWAWREAVPTFAVQLCVLFTAILLRLSVLGTNPTDAASLAFWNLSSTERVVGMVAIVPHWLRLLLWPAHLQAEYGPPAFSISGDMSGAHYLGLGVVGLWGILLLSAWRRAPPVAFGLAWIAIALLPVSNLLIPTGVVLAERTLFLPSAGMMLAVGSAWGWAHRRSSSGRFPRVTLGAATSAVLALGLWRSADRTRDWRDQDRFIAQLVINAPEVARAHKLAARHHKGLGRRVEAEAEWRRAYELWEGDPEVHEELGQVYRASGRCQAAVPVFASGLRKHPDRTTLRSRYIECLLALGDTTRAVNLAVEAVGLGHSEFERTVRRLPPPK